MSDGRPVRFGIVGCGLIGSLLDEARPSRWSQTHASALSRNPDVLLAAMCDADPSRLAAAGAARGVTRLYDDYRAMFARESLDAVSICTPAAERLAVIRAAADAGVRAVWCEKPLAADVATARQVVDLVSERRLIFSVNYLRRWMLPTERVHAFMRDGTLGTPQAGVAIYGKGTLNNASHWLDLFLAWFGAPTSVTRLGVRDDDRHAFDPTTDARLTFRTADGGEFPLHLVSTDHRHYSVFELDLFFQSGRVRWSDKCQHFEVFRVHDDPVYAGYRTVVRTESHEDGLAGAFENALTEIVGALRGELAGPRCDARDGLAVMELVEALLAPAAQ